MKKTNIRIEKWEGVQRARTCSAVSIYADAMCAPRHCTESLHGLQSTGNEQVLLHRTRECRRDCCGQQKTAIVVFTISLLNITFFHQHSP